MQEEYTDNFCLVVVKKWFRSAVIRTSVACSGQSEHLKNSATCMQMQVVAGSVGKKHAQLTVR